MKSCKCHYVKRKEEVGLGTHQSDERLHQKRGAFIERDHGIKRCMLQNGCTKRRSDVLLDGARMPRPTGAAPVPSRHS